MAQTGLFCSGSKLTTCSSIPGLDGELGQLPMYTLPVCGLQSTHRSSCLTRMQHYDTMSHGHSVHLNQHTLSRDQHILKQLVRFGPQLCAETKRPVEKKIKIRRGTCTYTFHDKQARHCGKWQPWYALNEHVVKTLVKTCEIHRKVFFCNLYTAMSSVVNARSTPKLTG